LDLVNVFLIIKGVDDLSFSDFDQFSHYSPTRQNSLKLYQKSVLRKVGQGSFV
jgi:hypothetical protein